MLTPLRLSTPDQSHSNENRWDGSPLTIAIDFSPVSYSWLKRSSAANSPSMKKSSIGK